MNPILFFKTPVEFRGWLTKNHLNETELFVGFYKVGTGKPSMTWPQSVDEALCYGWIDGIRKSIDSESYCIRFTPRRPTSIWSSVNIKKVEELIERGQMQPEGLVAFSKRKDEKSKIYSFENDPTKLADNLEQQFKANEKAWKFFSSQAPSYQKTAIHWIMSAKKESTQLSRLKKLIEESVNKTNLWYKK